MKKGRIECKRPPRALAIVIVTRIKHVDPGETAGAYSRRDGETGKPLSYGTALEGGGSNEREKEKEKKFINNIRMTRPVFIDG